jgi:multiple sugar transport system ATP-binding protein
MGRDGMAKVLFNHVSKKFGDNLVVSDLFLEIEDRRFTVLVGPSGCGKTTSLRMLAGLERPTSEEIYIGERMVNTVAPKDRNIAMVFQNYALYPHKNVFDNMAFGLVLRKYPREERRRVIEAAKILEIEDPLGRKPAQLSGGQRQRVAMGRAIVRKPQAFLFDEPLSNLDAKLRVQMRAEISKLHMKLQITVLYVTHDQVEAMTLADEIVVMNEGKNMQEGNPIDIYDNPKNLFVAGFIGSPSMNFMNVALVEENQRLYLKRQAFRVPIPDKYTFYKKYSGKEVILGIRPENIELFQEDLEQIMPGKEKIDAIVEVIEIMGSESIVFLRILDKEIICKVGGKIATKPGEKVTILFNMNEMHLFDIDTCKTIQRK